MSSLVRFLDLYPFPTILATTMFVLVLRIITVFSIARPGTFGAINFVPRSWLAIGWMVPGRYKMIAFDRSIEDLMVEYEMKQSDSARLTVVTRVTFAIRANLLALESLRASLVDRALNGPLDSDQQAESHQQDKAVVIPKYLAMHQR